jgi:cytochrome c oxidase assembly factor CtaG
VNGMDMSSSLPPLDWHSFVTSWQPSVGWTLACVVLLTTYVGGLLVCRRAGHRGVSSVRVACFVVGVALLWLTVSSGIAVYAMSVTWMHMVEHLMLIMVVPAFLVLGHPLTLALECARVRGHGDRVERVLRSGPVAVLTHPAVAVGQYAVVIVATHLTSFMDVMAVHRDVMVAEQVLYLVSGFWLLLPLIGLEPTRTSLPLLGRIGLALLAMTPDTVVGIVMLQSGHDLYPVMSRMQPSWAPSPVSDIQTAGALMWVAGDGLMMLIGVGMTIALISRPSSANIVGARLEGVRRRQLVDRLGGGDDSSSFGDDVDVDQDDEMLAAYNRMLGRLNGPGPAPRS